MLPKSDPDYQDADLVLRLYELRREPAMREARDRIRRDFWPKTFADVKAVNDGDHPLNTAWRQTTTYWEMAFGMARNGIIHADYLVETTGEGILLFAKVQPFLAQIREEINPHSFISAEWITTQCEAGRERFAATLARVQKTLKSK